MAQPPRHIRRTALVFLGALAAHLAIFQAIGLQSFRGERPAALYSLPATPIEIAPLPRSAKKPPRPKPVRRSLVRARPTLAAPADAAPPAAVAGSASAGAAELAPPLPPLANADSNAAEAPPPDLTAAAAPLPHYPINPGYWQVEEHWPLIERTERYCVEPWNIFRFMLAPCNHIYHCVYPVQTIGPDTFHFVGVITSRDARFDVHGGGDYTATKFRLSATGLGHWRIVPVVFSASLDGTFLGPDCPADAKRIHQR